MSCKDAVKPFVFETLPVRGSLVQLDSAWQRMQLGHEYVRSAAEILGHAAAATALIAQSLKFDGTVTLQISSDGPLGMLVMQSTEKLELRGMVSAADAAEDMTFADIAAGGHCAVTVDAGAMERPYQGIVEMHPDSLAKSLENYFDRSVQVPSHLILRANESVCGGILLQQMPGADEACDEDDWRRLGFLVDTLRTDELRDGATPELLHKLFAEDDVRVFSERDVHFRCRCSQSKVEEVLRLLGEAETNAALRESGRVDVTCEYCGKLRSFDAVDVRRVFTGEPVAGSDAVH